MAPFLHAPAAAKAAAAVLPVLPGLQAKHAHVRLVVLRAQMCHGGLQEGTPGVALSTSVV